VTHKLTDLFTGTTHASVDLFAGTVTESRPCVYAGDSYVVLVHARTEIPPLITHREAFYWTNAWQAGELESRADIEAGRVERFSDSRSAIRWLLDDDDNE
jgi:hypothetical protein